MIAAYAVADEMFGGRRHEEPMGDLHSPFELDRLRIVACTAFRRLEGKTQVFAPTEHDHFRTRLTHTLEVSQIARTLARLLSANQTLSEAIALAHDLGHPPFGHAGEYALSECMARDGGFNHNLHSLRVVEYLEHPYPPFRGLNVTGEVRDGLAAHCTRYDKPGEEEGGEPPPRASVEAQIASVADRLAYNCHDLEDAIGADIIGPEELLEVALWREAAEAEHTTVANRPIHAVRRVILDAIVTRLLRDAADASRRRLAGFTAPEEVKAHGRPLVDFAPAADALLAELERFLLDRVYKHPLIAASDANGRDMISQLFAAYVNRQAELPARFSSRIQSQGAARVIGDYIAGMTDRFCRREHERLTKPG